MNKTWYIQYTHNGIMIAPLYNGQFGCRLWMVETIGM